METSSLNPTQGREGAGRLKEDTQRIQQTTILDDIEKCFYDCKYCDNFQPHEETIYDYDESFACFEPEGEYYTPCKKFALNDDFLKFANFLEKKKELTKK